MGGGKPGRAKEIANAKSMSLCLKKPASLTTLHFKIPLVKICPPTRKAKNQDDISLMTSSSPHYDICVYYIKIPDLQVALQPFLEESLEERKVYLCLRVEVLNNH